MNKDKFDLIDYLLKNLIAAIVYTLTASLGLSFDAVGGFASLVWPPSGIALVVLLLYGLGFWPGIAVGAFLINLHSGAEWPAAITISFGNTTAAFLGAFVLQKYCGFRNEMDRVRDVISLIIVPCVLSSFVAASIGVSSLLSTGNILPSNSLAAWKAWWFGDAMGVLIFTPFLLTWMTSVSTYIRRHSYTERTLLLSSLLVVSGLVFGTSIGSESAYSSFLYLIFIPLIWAALRFHQRGVSSAILLVSGFAIVGTALGTGPFGDSSMYEGLIDLQIFMSSTVITMLLMGAVVSERSSTLFLLNLRLTHHLGEVQEEERERISREIHDDLGQKMAVIKLEVAWLRTRSGFKKELFESSLNKMNTLLDDSFVSIKRICAELRPSVLDEFGLTKALNARCKEFEEQTGILCSFMTTLNDLKFKDEMELALFRVLQEALNNISKHSNATIVSAKLTKEGDSVLLSIKDNGKGMDPSHFLKLGCLGIQGMQERISRLGGIVTIQPNLGNGVQLLATLPA